MAVFLARIVMPRSRSSSFESIIRSTCCSLERNVPLCVSMASTSVVLPWSTCAMMAILRMLKLKVWVVLYLRIELTGDVAGSRLQCPIYHFTMCGGFSGDYIALTYKQPLPSPSQRMLALFRNLATIAQGSVPLSVRASHAGSRLPDHWME